MQNPDCADAVGGRTDEDGDIDITAADVLKDLAGNIQPYGNNVVDHSHYGEVQFGKIAPPPDGNGTISATTGSYTSGGRPYVTLTINTAAGRFVSGSLQAQAVTILHELGHVIGFLFGSGASAIKTDDETTQAGRKRSADNTKIIEEKCFGKKK